MLEDTTPADTVVAKAMKLQPASLDALRSLDPPNGSAFVVRVLNTYLVSLHRQLDAARAARAEGLLAPIRAVAHTLKSSSESIGAVDFARQCASLEQAIRDTPAADGAVIAPLHRALDVFFAMADEVEHAVLVELGGTHS